MRRWSTITKAMLENQGNVYINQEKHFIWVFITYIPTSITFPTSSKGKTDIAKMLLFEMYARDTSSCNCRQKLSWIILTNTQIHKGKGNCIELFSFSPRLEIIGERRLGNAGCFKGTPAVWGTPADGERRLFQGTPAIFTNLLYVIFEKGEIWQLVVLSLLLDSNVTSYHWSRPLHSGVVDHENPWTYNWTAFSADNHYSTVICTTLPRHLMNSPWHVPYF